MPLEGHWERAHTPLRKTTLRERRILAAVSAVLVLGVAVALFATLRADSPEVGAGCVRLTIASSTGGATIHPCGQAAARWCRSAEARQGAIADKAAAQCRRAGHPWR